MKSTTNNWSDGYGVYQQNDVPSGRQIASFNDPQARIAEAKFAFSPDGRILAVSHCNEGIDIVDVASGRFLYRLPVRQAGSWVCFSPDGKSLACRDSIFRLRVWDLAEVYRQFERFEIAVESSTEAPIP